jgi:predicted RNase H-like nuclease (RuvC/YqgF family)
MNYWTGENIDPNLKWHVVNSTEQELEHLKGQFEQAKRYIKRLETQNEAMRKRINDPDRFPPIRKEDMFA